MPAHQGGASMRRSTARAAQRAGARPTTHVHPLLPWESQAASRPTALLPSHLSLSLCATPATSTPVPPAGRDPAPCQAGGACLHLWLCGECGAPQQPGSHGAHPDALLPCATLSLLFALAWETYACLSLVARPWLRFLPLCVMQRRAAFRQPHATSPCPRPLPSLQIGFFALLLVELVAGKGLLDLMGFTTGNGLGFEF